MNTKNLVTNRTIRLAPNLQWLIESLIRWERNISTRHQLLEMDDDRLADIGVDRKAAIHESGKPFWR